MYPTSTLLMPNTGKPVFGGEVEIVEQSEDNFGRGLARGTDPSPKPLRGFDPPSPKSDVSDFGTLRCQTRVNPRLVGGLGAEYADRVFISPSLTPPGTARRD